MSDNVDSNLEWLFKWFYRQCDGEWEHGKGIKIGTLDNPGWYLSINIEKTELQYKEFKKIAVERTDNDWIFCKSKDGVFEGDCGLFNFPEMLNVFRKWAENPNSKIIEDATNDIIKVSMSFDNSLEWLFKWFSNQCDGDWEHGMGVNIETLANPGWLIKINIEETVLQSKEFEKISFKRSEDNWISCQINDIFFEGHCGLFNLPEVLNIFREWAESEQQHNHED